MEYKLVHEGSIFRLEDAVNMYISYGWRPLGGPIVSAGWYTQALVKDE